MQLNLIDIYCCSMVTMQLFARVQRPDFYIVVEYNPDWREIAEALPNGERPNRR